MLNKQVNVPYQSNLLLSNILQKGKNNYLPNLFSNNSDSFLLPGCFTLGAISANNKDTIRINILILILFWILSVLLKSSVVYQFIFYIAFFYYCLYVASTKFVINRLKLPFDASYGIYLYGFMFQQCVFYLLPNIGVHGNQIITSILALTAGILSWYFVEKLFVNLGHQLAASTFAWYPQQNYHILQIVSISNFLK